MYSVDLAFNFFVLLLVVVLFFWVLSNQTQENLAVKFCSANDYYTPKEAISKGNKVSDILKVNSEGQLLYYQVAKNDCVTEEGNNFRVVKEPPYCLFRTSKGIKLEGKKKINGTYLTAQNVTIKTSSGCNPTTSDLPGTNGSVISGVAEAKWDAV